MNALIERPEKCTAKIFMIAPEQSLQLRQEADRRRISMSAIVRDALDAYFEAKKKGVPL